MSVPDTRASTTEDVVLARRLLVSKTVSSSLIPVLFAAMTYASICYHFFFFLESCDLMNLHWAAPRSALLDESLSSPS